jgi:hypothetical protein
METPKEYYYTYYSYEEWGRGYFGSRGCKCLPEKDVKYFGSSKDKTFKPKYKIILKDDYATREEAYADEIILHDYYDVANNPHFANRANLSTTKFQVSKEVAIENGKKNGKKVKELGIGIHGLTKEQMSENGKKAGKIGGKKTYELGIGIHGRTKEQITKDSKRAGNIVKELGIGIHRLTKEQMSENGRKGAKKQQELGIGIFGRTKEQMSENGRKGIKKQQELGLGIHGLTKEQMSENGKKNAKKQQELGIGIFGRTKEQMSENGKKAGKIGGKIVGSQKWKCLITGYVSNPGGLTVYQKARGIDKSMRVRLE